MQRIVLALGSLCLWIAIACTDATHSAQAETKAPKLPAVRDGDIIFQTSLSNQSKAIQLATKSKYSHVGLVLIEDGKPVVLEAASEVVRTPLGKWIARGKDQKYVVMRLKQADAKLNPESLNKLKAEARKYRGKPYDLYFGWSDDSIYCSEMVWKIYQRALGIELGTLRQIKDFDLSHPAVKAKMKERYGDSIPYDEQVIAPSDIFNASNLIQVDS